MGSGTSTRSLAHWVNTSAEVNEVTPRSSLTATVGTRPLPVCDWSSGVRDLSHETTGSRLVLVSFALQGGRLCELRRSFLEFLRF